MNHKLLIGKTIKNVVKRGIVGCDDKPYLDLYFTDGSKVTIIASYDSIFTGISQDEYRKFIKVGEIE